jgi:hypothetical protein
MNRASSVAILAAAVLVSTGLPAFATRVQAAPSQATAPAHHLNAHPLALDRTRFLAHMGAAFFAFHRYVLKPYEAGAFKAGAPHRVRNLVKAGLALAFAYHEVRVSYGIAKNSQVKSLHALASAVDALGAKMSAAVTGLKNGQFNAGKIAAVVAAVAATGALAAKTGFSIKDIPVSVPGN